MPASTTNTYDVDDRLTTDTYDPEGNTTGSGGTNYTYELLRRGEMPSIRVGSRFFIPKAALMKWLESAGDKPINAA